MSLIHETKCKVDQSSALQIFIPMSMTYIIIIVMIIIYIYIISNSKSVANGGTTQD